MDRTKAFGRNSRGQLYGMLRGKPGYAFGRNYWGDWVLWIGGRCFTLYDAGEWV